MNLFRLVVFAVSMAACVANAVPIESRSVGNEPAVAYDAPGAKGRKVFVVPRGMPIEPILTYGDWTKVRDSSGDLYWLETKSLSTKRTLIVKAANAKVRVNPDENGALVFSADKGVLLELAEPASSGWLKVKHRDGQSGYVKAVDVWGGD